MSIVVLSKSPAEILIYPVDFAKDLRDTDTAIFNIAGGSDVTCTDLAGTDFSSTIIASKTTSGFTLSCILQGGTHGQEFRVRFKGKGNPSNDIFERLLQLRIRNDEQGGF